jgi:Spy/CpxP family protein refolding chaperone
MRTRGNFMKINYIRRLFAAILIGLFSVIPAKAQEPGPGPGPGPGFGPPMDGPMRERVRERIKMMKVWKLTEDLGLSPAQSEKFFPVYNKFSDSREDIEKQKFDLIEKLDELTEKEKISDSEINRQLDKIDSLDQRIQELKLQFRKDVQGLLTTRQVGQLYVFEIKFIRQMQEIIRDVRQEAHGKGFGKGQQGE